MIPDDLTIRPAQAGDLIPLHALIEEAYRGQARLGWTHEADLFEGPRTDAVSLAATLARAGEIILLALDGDAIVGCVQLTASAPGVAYLGLLTVAPARQAGGLGRRLIAEAETEAGRRMGARTVELSVVSPRADLVAYYQRRGYRLTGETRPFPVQLDPPLDLVVLEKRLAG